ncbi:bifunctional DNA primase/polymerase [Herbidospora sp. RD11066]
MNALHAYAVAAADHGWHVFPLTPNAKTPLRGFTAWEKHATTDRDLIGRCWGANPFNIGIACGPSRLVVVDLDRPKPGAMPPEPFDEPGVNDGADALALLCERVGQPLPFDTFTVRTRNGGTHLYFTAPIGLVLGNTAGRLGWLIDTRASGGYVVGPGSNVPTPGETGEYEVTNAIALAELPAWLASRLTEKPPALRNAPASLGGDQATRYAWRALHGETERLFSAGPGTRNSTLNEAAFALGQLIANGLLPRHLVEGALQEAAETIGLPAHEAATTIRSGLTAGARTPRRDAR